jgi:hypothetical protein
MRVVRFFETVYADNEARSASERRKRAPDLLRYLRNALLGPLDALLARWYARSTGPIVFIVGAPRSGTTLLYQTIARHLAVGYVSNALASYWGAPLVGARLLCWRKGRVRQHEQFSSEYGRTRGAMGPHEFSWFWHYWGDFRAHDDLRGVELENVRWDAIALRLRGLSGLYRAPLVIKSINFTDYQVDELARRLPDARFLWITREPFYCAQSILQVRERRYEDVTRWWSVRPRDVDQWHARPAEEQVVHQIRDIEHSLSRAQASLEESRFLRIRYEELVDAPADVLGAVARFLEVDVLDPDGLDRLSFKSRNESTLEPEPAQALERALGCL